MFIQNKYLKWYTNIINSAKNRVDYAGYTELHHIIPKSLGGTDEDNNIVRLSAREHFVCHVLLTKFTQGQSYYKMIYACQGMRRSRSYQQRYINSRLYATIKNEAARIQKEIMTGKKLSEKHKAKISSSLKGRTDTAETIQKRAASNRGKKRTLEQRERMSQAQLNLLPRTPEQKAAQAAKASRKISEKLKGLKKSEEHKKKISESLKGLTKGISKSEETKKKMRKPKSEEHKKAISEGRKAKYALLRLLSQKD